MEFSLLITKDMMKIKKKSLGKHNYSIQCWKQKQCQPLSGKDVNSDRQEVLPGAEEDGSAVKKIGCSCRGPVSSYRHYMVPYDLL